MFCFFKQKTAYEMRISDWSSDVCSSDLAQAAETVGQHLDRAGPHDRLAVFGHRLQDREHQVLLAQSGCALNTLFLGHGDEFGWRFPLEIVKMHVSIHETGGSPAWEWRIRH